MDGVLTGILQAERTAVLTADWRRGAVRLLAALEEAGAAIIVPPAEGEFPRERLPFAEGRRLAQLFAFAGAAEALHRQGRNPEESAFLLAGGEPHIWGRVLSSLGNEVNRLAIFTQEPETAEGVVQRLYAERGLMAEVFSSPKNAALGAADVVLSCGMEQRAYEHILKRGCIWLDFAGNRPVLRRLRSCLLYTSFPNHQRALHQHSVCRQQGKLFLLAHIGQPFLEVLLLINQTACIEKFLERQSAFLPPCL